ncbi:MAG: hypothetical protein ACYCT2_04475 [Thermoplasmataceae archaeon]
MGKITDAAIAIIVLVIGLWILTRLGLTLPAIEKMFHQFFFPSSGTTTNATSGAILGMAASVSRLREKKRRVLEYLRRKIFLERNKIIPKSTNDGGGKS